jgi:diketogulonate reductase-like aldo/keto reductase
MAASCVSKERTGVPVVALSLGKPMPRVGFGTASATLGQAEGRAGVTEAVLSALSAGYRHFDTASAYNSEAAVGDAVIHAAAVRDDLYITTKLAITDAHPGRVLPALHKSLRLVLAIATHTAHRSV